MIEIFEKGEDLTRKNFNNYYKYILYFKTYDFMNREHEREYIVNNCLMGGRVFTTHDVYDGNWWYGQGRTIKELLSRVYSKYPSIRDLKIIQVRDLETYNKWKLAQKLKM